MLTQLGASLRRFCTGVSVVIEDLIMSGSIMHGGLA